VLLFLFCATKSVGFVVLLSQGLFILRTYEEQRLTVMSFLMRSWVYDLIGFLLKC